MYIITVWGDNELYNSTPTVASEVMLNLQEIVALAAGRQC